MPRSATAFIRKTYELVSDPKINDIIRWKETGDSFVIAEPSTFVDEILPSYFKHNNLNSFIRQLNTYGFKKIVNKNTKELEFKHKLFLKEQHSLLPFIVRRSNTSKMAAKKEDETYSNIKKVVEEHDVIETLKKENEKMAKEMAIVKMDYYVTKSELDQTKKELLEARDLLNKYSQTKNDSSLTEIPFGELDYNFLNNLNGLLDINTIDINNIETSLVGMNEFTANMV